MDLSARERVRARGYCTGPSDGAPKPGDIGLDKRAACCTCGRRVAITVGGRYAHHMPKDPPLMPAVMNDHDRTRLATRSGGRMLGPTERERCQRHRRRWVLYRWTWRVGSGPEDGEPEIVRGCGACAAEDEVRDDA